MTAATTRRPVIHCRLSGASTRAAARVAVSFVHHQCQRADTSVGLTDTLEEAVCDIVSEIERSGATITGIGMTDDRRELQLSFEVDAAPGSIDLMHHFGPLADAVFDRVAVDASDRLLLVRNLVTS